MVTARLRGLLGWSEAEASGSPKASQKKSVRANRYQAVTVVCPGKCCAAAKALTGKRILARSAPTLPLPACSLADQCRCSFRKYDDRRDENRRLPGELTKWYGGAEKRISRGRRGAD